MKINDLISKIRMRWLFLGHDLTELLRVARRRDLKTAIRHARLCKRVYRPWVSRKIAEAGLFDRDFYVRRYVRGKVLVDPFEHYLRRGIFHDLLPNPNFDPLQYRFRHMDLSSRIAPGIDYICRNGNGKISGPDGNGPCAQGSSSPRLGDLIYMAQTHQIHVSRDSTILDFGCGDGGTVADLREHGFRSFGYDIVERLSEHALKYRDCFRFNEQSIDDGNNCRNVTNYTLKAADVALPYPAAMFDLVFSYQTLEHVFNLDASLAEISRILKPGGIALHIYPPRDCFMERHYCIPLGHRLHFKWYFALWAALGLCGRHRKECPRLERGKLGYLYVLNATNYTSNKAMLEIAKKHFARASISPWPGHVSLNFIKDIWTKIFPPDVLLICRKGDG